MARLIIVCATAAVLCGASIGRAEPLGCLIQPFQEADVGSQVVGVLDEVMVGADRYPHNDATAYTCGLAGLECPGFCGVEVY